MASLLPNGRQTFIDENGDPLVGGKVYFYVPNTTTPKDTWQDIDKTILNTNPIVLDSLGSAVIFGEGAYRQVLEDINAVQIWDELTYSSDYNSSGGAYIAIYETKAQLEAATVPPGTDFVDLLGYAAVFDNGGGMYQRSVSLPSHNGYIQDASGAIFVLRTETVAMEQFGGFPNAGSVTAAWNSLLGYAEDEGKFQGLAYEGVYTFLTKPNAINFQFAMKGKGKSKTSFVRGYSEATNADAFMNIQQLVAGPTTNGCRLEEISVVAGTGTSNGIMVQGKTDGPIAGFYYFNVNITYTGTGQFDRCLSLDGMANTTLGGQGLRDCVVEDCDLFAPTSATNAFYGANVIALRADIATFGLFANSGIKITGGTAASNADKSHDCRLIVDCISRLDIDHALRINSFGDTEALTHGTNSDSCTHSGTVGITGYIQTPTTSNNLCLSPSVAPITQEVGQLAGLRNGIINGAMAVDQRNTGAALNITNSWQYGIDRWAIICGAAPSGTLTMQRVSGSGLSSPFAMRVARSAGTFASNISWTQVIETRNVWKYLGRRMTIHFKARRGSNFQGDFFSLAIITGTGTDQGVGGVLAGTWTGWANIGSAVFPLTTSEQKFKLTTPTPINTNVREIAFLFGTGLFTGTGDANDWIEITEVQAEPGAIDLSYCQFEYTDPSLQRMLCQRYCQTFYAQASVATGTMATTTSARVGLITGTEMRIAAPAVVTTLANTRIRAGGTQVTPSDVSNLGFIGNGYLLNFTTTALTQYENCSLALSGTQTLILDAELN